MEITIKTRFNVGDKALLIHYNDDKNIVSILKCEITDIAFSFNNVTKHTPVSFYNEKVFWVTYTAKHDFMEFDDTPEHLFCTSLAEAAEKIESNSGNNFKI